MEDDEVVDIHDTLKAEAAKIRGQYGADCVLIIVAIDNENEATSQLVYGASGHTLLRRAMADEYVQSTFDRTFATREELTGEEDDDNG